MNPVYRINIPVPDAGWLTQANLHTRPSLSGFWVKATAIAATAARTPPLRTVAIAAYVRDSSVHYGNRRRIRVAEDVRPSLGAALRGLVAAGVLTGSDRRYVVADSLELGASTGDLEPLLVLELTEVRSDV